MIDGEITLILYRYGTMVDWLALGATPPQIPLNTQVGIACVWANSGDEIAVGHIDVTITAPDGTTTELVATAFQDTESAPGEGAGVVFSFALSQLGSYSGEFVLLMDVAGATGCVPEEVDVTFAAV